MLSPHDAPSVSGTVVSLQTGVPVEQFKDPAWHGLAGRHGAPVVHSPQTPPEQTRFMPHDAPSGAFIDSTQTAAPVLHAVFPRRHGLSIKVQLAPFAHAVHSPLELHTLSGPHAVPGATAVPVSVQTGAPLVHTSDPV
jgi:hypothetical protein